MSAYDPKRTLPPRRPLMRRHCYVKSDRAGFSGLISLGSEVTPSRLRALAAEVFFTTIDFGLRYISVLHQRRNACVRQFVAVLAHAVFQTFGFESPLMAKISIIICTVLHVFVGGLRRADTTNNQKQRR